MTAAWWVYMVRCSDDSLYTGVATDVLRRVAEHNHSDTLAAKYTRARRPVVLVYRESCSSRAEAGRREYAIKQMNRQAKEALCLKFRKSGGKRENLQQDHDFGQ